MLSKSITDFSSLFPRCGKIDKKEESKYLSFFNKNDVGVKCLILEQAHDLFVFALDFYKKGDFDLNDKSVVAFKHHYIDVSKDIDDYKHNIQYFCFYNAIINYYRSTLKLSLDEILNASPELVRADKKDTDKVKKFKKNLIYIEDLIVQKGLSLQKIYNLLFKKDMSFSYFRTLYYQYLKVKDSEHIDKNESKNFVFDEIEEKQATLAQLKLKAELAKISKFDRRERINKRAAVAEQIIVIDLYVSKCGWSYRSVCKKLFNESISYSLLEKIYRRYKQIKSQLSLDEIDSVIVADPVAVVRRKTNAYSIKDFD